MLSMTGYAKTRFCNEDLSMDIEIKSVNGRFMELKISLPRDLSFLEYEIRRLISSAIQRGTIDVRISFSDHRPPTIELNESKLMVFNQILNKAYTILGTDAIPPLDYLLKEAGVVETSNKLDEDPELKDAFSKTIHEAINKHRETCKEEGVSIRLSMNESLVKMNRAIDAVESEIEPYKVKLLETLKTRTIELLGGEKYENLEQRLVQETAIYIDRYDVHEEITRLRSHISTLKQLIDKDSDESVGKTMNFILQEVQREANTLGSKFSTSITFKDILILKEEIEKCREICQNVA